MNKQMTMSLISDELRQAATPKKELLERMDRIIPWSRWTELVQPYYIKESTGISLIRWSECCGYT